jgi:hypothetical protein
MCHSAQQGTSNSAVLSAFIRPCASTHCHSAQPSSFTYSTYCRHTKYCRHLFWHSSGLDSKFPSLFEQLCDLKRIKEQAYNTCVCVYIYMCMICFYHLIVSYKEQSSICLGLENEEVWPTGTGVSMNLVKINLSLHAP